MRPPPIKTEILQGNTIVKAAFITPHVMLSRRCWNASGVLMAGDRWVGVRARCWTASVLALLAGIASKPAIAADCPGHPDALGTSRTLVVDPTAHPLIGTMQYRETLPLDDGEVVLTFDDGPLPKYSNQILDILAAP